MKKMMEFDFIMDRFNEIPLVWIDEFIIFFQWAGISVYYLLGMWSRLVTSVRFLKTDTANLLDEYAPKIIEGFISSRFDSLRVR